MELPRRLTTALQAMTAAIDQLDAAAGRRLLAEQARAALKGELSVMQKDRMRLAGELGRSLASNQALLAANAEVGARLDRVAIAVRALAALQDDAAPDENMRPAGEAAAVDAPSDTAG